METGRLQEPRGRSRHIYTSTSRMTIGEISVSVGLFYREHDVAASSRRITAGLIRWLFVSIYGESAILASAF